MIMLFFPARSRAHCCIMRRTHLLMDRERIIKRVNVNLDAHLHDRFKAAVAARGKNMTEVLIELIEAYLRTRKPPGGRENE